MAVVATIKGYRVAVKLDGGTTETGKVKTLSVSLGGMKQSGADPEKIMAVVDLLAPIFDDDIYSVEETTVKTLSA